MRLLSHIRPATSLALAATTGKSSIRPLSSSSSSPTTPPSPPLVHSSFLDLVDLYDAFILDQFGVLHDGSSALDGAVELCRYLAEKANKKLIILSNTSAPSAKALAKLPKLGFDANHFVGAVTSGEEASHYVKETYGKGMLVENDDNDDNDDTTTRQRRPSRALMFTWDAFKPNNPRLTAPPAAFLEQCGNVQVAASVEEADFVLLHGSEIWYRGDNQFRDPTAVTTLGGFIQHGGLEEAIDPILQDCLRRNLPLVCANPDLIVQTPTGGTAHMPGKIAQRYAQLGGDCQVFGKPAVQHFEACIRELDMDDKSRVAHVGDSLHHDIAGAVAAGIPNCFVTSGIHRPELGTTFGELPDPETLDRLLQDEGFITPTHVVSAFRI